MNVKIINHKYMKYLDLNLDYTLGSFPDPG